MYGIAAHPGPSGVSANTLQLHAHTQRSLATGFDASIGRFTENGNVANEKVGTSVEEFAQSTFRTGDFFTGVEDKCEIDDRFGERGRKLKHYGEPALHVGRADAEESATFNASGCIVGRRNGVGMASKHNAVKPPE